MIHKTIIDQYRKIILQQKAFSPGWEEIATYYVVGHDQ